MVQKQALTGGLREGPWGCSLFYWAGALHRSRVKLGYALLRYPPTTKPPGLPKTTVEEKTKAFISLHRKASYWCRGEGVAELGDPTVPPPIRGISSSSSAISISARWPTNP